MEPGYSGSERFELGATSWYVSWCLDTIHQTLLVVLDTRSPKLALRYASIGIGHVDLTISRHQILQVILIFLLFLSLSLHPSLRHLIRCIQIGSLSPLISPLILVIRFFRDGFVVFILIETLIGNVVISGRVLHRTVHRGLSIAVVVLNEITNVVAVLAVTGLVLFDLVHQATKTRAAICLQDLHAEDLRDLAVCGKDILVKHSLATLIDNVTILVDEVASSVHQAALSVNQVAILVLVEDRL